MEKPLHEEPFSSSLSDENASPDSIDSGGVKPDYRASKLIAERRMKSLGFEDPEVAKLLAHLDRLLPDKGQLSSGESLGERFQIAADEMSAMRSPLLSRRSKATDQDALENAERYFRSNREMDRLVESEGDLTFGIMVAYRNALAHELAAQEAAGVAGFLQGELVRRRNSIECYKYTLPKTMLAFHAVIEASGLKRVQQLVRMKFFQGFIDYVHGAIDGKVSRDELLEAARKAEELFSPLADSGDDKEAEDHFDLQGGKDHQGARARLADGIAELKSRPGPQAGESVRNGIAHLKLLEAAQTAGGSLNEDGHLVIGDIDAFLAADIFAQETQASSETNAKAVAEVKSVEASVQPVDDAAQPSSRDDPRVAQAEQKRSQGFASCRSSNPFAVYDFVKAPPPFQHVPLRDFPVGRPSITGEIEPLDLVRLEVNDTDHRLQVMPGKSSVLGRLHTLMLPPHASAIWYGQQLGWGEVELRDIAGFGNAGQPIMIDIEANSRKMLRALRGVAELRMRELATFEPSHLVADPIKAGEAAEDLARWWLYVLFYRHESSSFVFSGRPGIFHGVEAPDVSMQDGKAVLGNSYIRMISCDCEKWEREFHFDKLVDANGKDIRRRPVFEESW